MSEHSERDTFARALNEEWRIRNQHVPGALALLSRGPYPQRTQQQRIAAGIATDVARRTGVQADVDRAVSLGGYHGIDCFTAEMNMDVVRQFWFDMMHTIAGGSRLGFGVMLNVGKWAFTLGRRAAEVNLRRFPELKVEDKNSYPHPPWQATEAGVARICSLIRDVKWPQGSRDKPPCPATEISRFKSHHWHMLTGALAVRCVELSEMAPPQAEATRRYFKVLGLMRMKIVNPAARAMKQAFVIQTLVMCEARLPLYCCTMVRHCLIHFYSIGGWVDDVCPGPVLQNFATEFIAGDMIRALKTKKNVEKSIMDRYVTRQFLEMKRLEEPDLFRSGNDDVKNERLFNDTPHYASAVRRVSVLTKAVDVCLDGDDLVGLMAFRPSMTHAVVKSVDRFEVNNLVLRTSRSEAGLKTRDSVVCYNYISGADGRTSLAFGKVRRIVQLSRSIVVQVRKFEDVKDGHLALVDDLMEGVEFRTVQQGSLEWISTDSIEMRACLLLPVPVRPPARELFNVCLLP